ncbi:MAG TPA: dihydroorotase, partial [Hellea balneolensis]|nr:dihydroorotase [Hellea balneolensis]
MSSLAIIGARIIDPHTGRDEIGTLLLEDGVIQKILEADRTEDIPPHAEQVSADGLILCPGLIDMRVCTGEPGAEHKETIKSAGHAAAAGGVTSIVLMPATNPVIDDISLVDHILNRGAETTDIRVYPAAALTKGLAGSEMTEIGLMDQAGAVLFSNGDTPISDARLMRRIMSYSSTFNALIAHRAVDADLSAGACAHESDFSARLGLPSAPATSERIMAERDIALAELTGA